MRTLSQLPANFSRTARLVAIGASAGGIEALLEVLSSLGGAFTLPVVVVMHMPEDRDSSLTGVFTHRCLLPVREAADKMPIDAGSIYFAPPGYHLLVEDDMTFSLSCDPPERFSRPSIDALLMSCADALGAQLVAIVLTGANDDGARGLAQAAAAGALTVVQDPDDARSGEMPRAAIAWANPDFILPLAGIRELLSHVGNAA